MKQQIHQYYKQLVQDRIDVFQDMISGLTVDAQNDAKGSAGDKHETALSMMHLEQEKLNHKLQEVLAQKAILDKIDTTVSHQKVALGSLVQTNGMWLFVSTALPKISIEGITVFAISPQSPLGSKLMGNGVGFTAEINGKEYLIESLV
jgi:transcription elongation GreA/GreB family factor